MIDPLYPPRPEPQGPIPGPGNPTEPETEPFPSEPPLPKPGEPIPHGSSLSP